MSDFLFDDFFTTDETPGVEVAFDIQGRSVPIILKRGISFKDFSEAKEQAVTMRINPVSMQPEILKYDDAVFGVELLVRCIKSWPFVDKGMPVPVTRETIKQLNSLTVQAMVLKLQEIMQKGKDALTPFVPASDVLS